MKMTLIAAAAQAVGLGGLAAMMIEVAGAKMPVPVLCPGVKLNIDGRPDKFRASVLADSRWIKP